MTQSINLFAVLAIAHYCSYIILSNLVNNDKYLRKYFLISVLIIGITIFTQSILFSLLFLVFLCFTVTKGFTSAERLILFLGLVFVLPEFPAFRIEPGFYFGDLTYMKALIIGLVLPVFKKTERSFENDKINIIDFFAIAFLFWIMLRNLNEESITVILRTNTWIVIEYMVPYFAIRFYLKNYSAIFIAISFGLIAQSFVSIFEAVFTWKLYETLRYISGYEGNIFTAYKMRHGFLRTEAVFGNPLVLSLFCNIAFLCAYLLRKYRRKYYASYGKAYFALIAVLATVLGAFFTGSRAGMAGIFLVVLLVIIVEWAVRRKIDPRNMVAFTAAFGLFLFFYLGQEFIQTEFPYRHLLFHTSIEVMQSNLVLGSLGAFDDPRMEVLRQGEGIIDPVNTYIWIALVYGLVGLVLFAVCILSGLKRLYICLRNIDDDRYVLGLFVLCALSIVGFNLATTSPIGWTYDWIWILMPICSNLAASYKNDIAFQGSPQKHK